MTQKSEKEIGEIKVLCLICQENLQDPKDTICTKCLKSEPNHSQIDQIKIIISQDSNKEVDHHETQLNLIEQTNKLEKGKRFISDVHFKPQTDSSKCTICKKKTGIYGFTCKHCSANYCKFHRLPQEHECQTDFITEGRKKLKLQNPCIKSIKLNPI